MRGNQEFFLLALEGRQPTGTLSGHGGIVGFVGFVGYLRQVSVPSVAKQVASILYRAAERQGLGNPTLRHAGYATKSDKSDTSLSYSSGVDLHSRLRVPNIAGPAGELLAWRARTREPADPEQSLQA